jgi:lysozyme
MREQLRRDLIRDEGLRLKLYRCPAGFWTIGVGRNLEGKGLTASEQRALFGTDGCSNEEVIAMLRTRGITKPEAMYLLDNDIDECEADLRQHFPWFADLNEPRQNALINMRFNLGPKGFRGFRNTLGAVARRDYPAARRGMLLSKWATQVGARATRIADTMEAGL